MAKPETPSPAAAKPEVIKLGHEWAVPVNSSAEVTFTSPEGRDYVVHTRADGAGGRTAGLVLNVAGDWTAVASNGDESTATAK